MTAKSKAATWAIQRTHKVTGSVFYLSPGEVNWVSPEARKKYGTRYGRFHRSEAERIINTSYQSQDFQYEIVLHATVK